MTERRFRVTLLRVQQEGLITGVGAAEVSEQAASGDVLCSSDSQARFLVIEVGSATGMPKLGGRRLSRGKPLPCSAVEAVSGAELQVGRRYADPVTGLTLLCIAPGRGALSFEGRTLAVSCPSQASRA